MPNRLRINKIKLSAAKKKNKIDLDLINIPHYLFSNSWIGKKNDYLIDFIKLNLILFRPKKAWNEIRYYQLLSNVYFLLNTFNLFE